MRRVLPMVLMLFSLIACGRAGHTNGAPSPEHPRWMTCVISDDNVTKCKQVAGPGVQLDANGDPIKFPAQGGQ